MHTPGAQVNGFIGILIVQITILILYGIFVRYDYEMLPSGSKNANTTSDELLANIEKEHRVSYPRKFHVFFSSKIIYVVRTINRFTLETCKPSSKCANISNHKLKFVKQ